MSDFLQVVGFDPLVITAPQGAPGVSGANGTNGTNGVSVVSAAINGSNHLILTMSDASTIDAGALPSGGGGGAVASVNTKTGTVVLTADDIGDGITFKSFLATERTKLAAISGTNTGDETTATIKSKLSITTLSGSNTGDQDLSALAATSYVDGKVIDSIADADTTHAPSRNAVFDALALKQPLGVGTLPSNVRTIITNATLVAGDTARCNASAGPLTITLPASPTAGQAVIVKKIDAVNPVTISGGNIEGNTSLILDSPLSSVFLVFTSQWEIAGSVGNVSGGVPVPFIPAVGATAVGNGQVTVFFTPAGPPATSYTVTSSPGGFTATGSSSPLTVTGLTNGTAYTFTVTSTNSTGSAVSAATAAVTPSSFVPSSISTLTAWYDPAHVTSLADGAAISSLADLTGNGFTALQATGTKQPTFRCSSTAVTLPNNQPVMQFSGAQALATILTAPNIAQPNTIFVVGSQTVAGVVAFLFDGGNARESIHFDTDHFLDFYAGTVVHSTTPEPMAFSSICVQHNGASGFLRKGGTQIASGNSGAANLTGITIGAAAGATANFLTGLIGEVLVYHGALTVPQIQQVEAYLLNKWGV